MKKISIQTIKAININALDLELQNAIGADYIAVSKGRGKVVVYLANGTADALVQSAQSVVNQHDASQLSPEQAAEQVLQQAITSARAAHPDLLDVNDFSASNSDVQTLAAYIAWLELEIRDLRGL